MTAKQRQQAIAGAALIILGLALYFLEGLGHSAVFILVGGVFVVAYFYKREFGFLVPGCIILGLGIGSLGAAGPFSFGQSRMLGLGFGFVVITLIGLFYERQFHWWPLIPGGALILLGMPKTEQLVRALFDNWPLILVLVGVLILVGALFHPKTKPTG